MKEAIVEADISVTIHDGAPVPTPSASQVLIRVACAGVNPKDWKQPFFSQIKGNTGDDMAGYITAVGTKVMGFKVGDRVAAFHTMNTPGGAFAEYGLAEHHTTFHLPDNVTFEEAVTIPLCGYTAAVALFANLKLPMLWNPPANPMPLIVYGGSTAVGAFAIKLARQAGIYPIIAVAGSGIPYVETLLDRSRGDAVIDYRAGKAGILTGIEQVLNAAGALGCGHAIDAVCEDGSFLTVSAALMPGGEIALIRPGFDYSEVPETLRKSIIYVGAVNGNPEDDKWLADLESKSPIPHRQDLGLVWSTLFRVGLRDGWLQGHPYELVDGGLAGLSKAMKDLKDGKASAKKFVVRVTDAHGQETCD